MIQLTDIPPKHPDSIKFYWPQWNSEELNGAVITQSEWTVGADLQVEETVHIGSLIGVRLSGGTLGNFVKAVNKITLDNSEVLHVWFMIEISENGH